MTHTPPPKNRAPDWTPHVTARGESFDLSHLNEYRTTFTTTNGNVFHVTVKFGHHCFTRKQEATDTPDMVYRGSPHGDVRVFDPDRYGPSKDLPLHIAGFMTGQCFNTGNGKFFVIKIVTHDGKVRDYEIYFRVYRANSPKGVVVDIRSAFFRDPDRLDTRTHQGKIHFGAILSNVQKGKQPRPASHQRKKI